MLKRLMHVVKSTIFHPVRARIVFDLCSTITTVFLIQVPFVFFASDQKFDYTLLLFPVIVIFLNYIYGIYTELKTVSPIIKTAIILFSTITTSVSLLLITTLTLQLVLIFLFASVLLILPRLFFQFSNNSRYSAVKTVLNQNAPILIVGGGGYIGSHVVEQLLRKKYKVRVLDKFLYGKEVLSDLQTNPNLELVEGDVTNLYDLTRALENVQAVIHLAGIVGDPACAVDEKMTQHINIVSTRMLKESVKALGIPRFIFASSCSVYGTNENLVDETSELNPVSLYAKTKIDAEKEILSEQYDEYHPTILRFATVFGHSRKPRFDLVVNLFTAQAYIDGVVTVTGSNQWRPFIHVSDVAKAVIMAFEAPLSKVSRQIFNVGDDRLNVTIGRVAELAQLVVSHAKNGKKVVINQKDDVTDKRNYHVSFEKISKVLGFKSSIMMEQGIQEMKDNFVNKTYKKNYKDPYYSNVEMTRQMIKEFYSDEYKHTHFSTLED
jgi:nucleoside-diphosphate-sugar epimerase